MNDTLNELLSIIAITFCLLVCPLAWWVWVFVVRTRREVQPSPKSKVTPLGVYGPVR